jgi:S-DNA-T family DNA segregation ATPase FtsK/SpoIIIE
MNRPSLIPKKDTPPSDPGPQGNLVQAANLLVRFRRWGLDILGILLLAFSLLTLVSLLLPGLTGGRLANAWRTFLVRGMGWGAVFVVAATAVAGLLVLRIRFYQARQEKNRHASALPPARWGQIIALELAAFLALVLLTLLGGQSVSRAESGLDGGFVGWGLADLLRSTLAKFALQHIFWSYLLVLLGLFVCLFFGLGLAAPLRRLLRRWDQTPALELPEDQPAVSVAPAGEPGSPGPGSAESKKRRAALPAEYRKKLPLPQKEEKSSPPPPRDEQLPPLELLVREQTERQDERNINQTAGLIEKTLGEFGFPAKVVGYRIGPTVTQFAIEPGFVEKYSAEDDASKMKVRVAQIASLRRDLALALAAERLRIEAPVPGRPYIGIEVPNVRTSVVRLRPMLENEAFYKVGSSLAIALGRDVSGQPVVADLSSMPHLLIAGTTGSGKSVCIAALTACLVMNNTPADLRLVMIDPKMVELVRFNGLPHLYGKVETDIQRILGVLRWVVAEMDHRYKLLEEMHARNLDAYNRKLRRRGAAGLPAIVVMIDELADLMMSAPDQTEPMLIRLAQLARATGIHLVVATQRPSTDVVTGMIKANFPARISFAVASSVDSRVILDTVGAESLLGHGDMLFLPPEAPAPKRVQGVMVTDSEVEKVITYWQRAHPQTEAVPPWEQMLKEESVLADRDELVKKAIELLRGEEHASTSMLQRRLRVGYPRAARLMDELEELGVVGPSVGAGREREVFFGPDDENPLTRPKGEDEEENGE